MDIQAIKPGIAEIAKKYDLDLVVLFGSQATGRTHAKSDVDIAVAGPVSISIAQKLKLLSAFEEVFEREDIEIIDLRTASPTLMYVVVRDGKLIYESQSGGFMRWKLYAIRIWMETNWLRQLRDKRLIEWADNMK